MATLAYRRLALIAGGGRFPFEIADRIKARGIELRVIALRGFADKGLSAYGAVVVDMLDPRGLMSELTSFAPDAVVLAGGVTRPGAGVALSVFSAFRNRAEIARVFAHGDDGLLGGAIKLLEDNGLKVVGVDEVAPELLMPLGVLGRTTVPADCAVAIETGTALLATISAFDVGQAVVVAGKRVLAVEGPEGTAALLERVKTLRGSGRVADREPAVLIKRAKHGQDRRADLPAIGPKTIAQAKAAGLAGIALGAGDVITIERDELVRAADQAGLFVTGIA